jgi:TfoX/Sxy family transcriptional regulator of competence genes
MKWRPATAEIIEIFEKAAPDAPRAERRKMFGYPCAFVNGNMFMGVHQESLVLRLPDLDRAELLQVEGACVFEPMEGRVMREYVAIPPSLLADPEALGRWVDRSLSYVSSLPPKVKKARKKRVSKKKG